MEDENILKIEELTKDFGGVKALDEYNMLVKEGEIHGLIGPNGAGKSTLFNIISGFLAPTEGKIYFKNKTINNLPPHKRAALGLGRTFQKSNIVTDMSVLDNVMAGMFYFETKNPIKKFFTEHFSIFKREKRMEKKALEALDFVGLSSYEHRWSSELVWVERQLLQLARAIVSKPDLLLLDEPAAGMGKDERKEIMNVINKIRDSGITVVVISHDMDMVMNLCDYISVINYGELLFSGEPEDVRKNKEVMEAYTGE